MFGKLVTVFGKVVHIFGKLEHIFGKLVNIFGGNSFPDLRHKFREIWSHYGNRGFRMILPHEGYAKAFFLFFGI